MLKCTPPVDARICPRAAVATRSHGAENGPKVVTVRVRARVIDWGCGVGVEVFRAYLRRRAVIVDTPSHWMPYQHCHILLQLQKLTF
jgi:hypothetical protein